VFSVTGAIKRLSEALNKRRQRQQANKDTSFDKKLILRLADKRMPTAKQLKHLPRYLSPRERTALKALAALIFAGLLAIGVKFYNDHVQLDPADGGDYSEAVVGGPHFINPILASANDADYDIVGLVFSGLMRTDTRGELVPDLAASYEISPDGRTYTFRLRDNLIWHDNAELLAADIVATINYIKDPAWQSPYYAQFKNVNVEATDDKTVKFTLNEPFAPFLSLLTVGILPEHLWQEVEPANAARADLNIKPVGSGPFKFKSLIKDKKGAIHSYTLAVNDAYYGQRPHLATVTFRFYPDFGTAVDDLLKKKVGGISFVPPESREEVERSRSISTYLLHLPQYTAVFFNQNKNPLLKSRAVRQALALALDKNEIMRQSGPDANAPVYGPILPGFVGFHPDVRRYTFDVQAAAGLLEAEGWKVGDDGVRYKEIADAAGKTTTRTPLSITLTTVDNQENIAVAQQIKKNWESVGVRTELEIVPASKIQKDKIRPREYDALLYGEIIGPDPDPYPFWHSSQNASPGLNLAVFSNRRVDELLEKARSTNNQDERAAFYKEFQDILADEAPAIFLYSPAYIYAVTRQVQGIDTPTIFTPADRFSNIANWYIKIKRVWKN
jgi:peptide/nickel transport system substrate-binding protein